MKNYGLGGTDEDEAPELGSGSVSDVRERERLLAATLAHSAMQDARYEQIAIDPLARHRWKWVLSSFLLVAAVWVSLAPPTWITGPDRLGPSEGDLEAGARAAVYLQAQQVEAFRARHGVLPSPTDEIVRLPGTQIVRSGGRGYQVRAWRPGARRLIYDSTRPTQSFEVVAAGWLDSASPTSPGAGR